MAISPLRAEPASPWRGTALALASVALLQGCQTTRPVTYEAVGPQVLAPQPANPPGWPPSVESLAGGNFPPQVMAPAMPFAETYELRQRLDRIEQALLRLDRRMQLVERNELSRMSGFGPRAGLDDEDNQLARQSLGLAAAPAPAPDPARGVVGRIASVTPAAFPEPSASFDAQQFAAHEPATGYQQGFMPVSGRESQPLGPTQGGSEIHASLQAGPPRLPSLADPSANATGQIPLNQARMAIWTVNFEPDKVWPDREQLPGSQRVVDLLRRDGNVAIVARGANPANREFQERVRALSRYLAKVSSLDSVPIQAMPAPQLGRDTIEILATP